MVPRLGRLTPKYCEVGVSVTIKLRMVLSSWNLKNSLLVCRAMEKVRLLVSAFAFGAFICYGIFSILEVAFPSLRPSNFNHWEIDSQGSHIEIMGWRKYLSPPRVIAQGYMSDRTACAVALAVGVVFMSVGIYGIRHILM